MLAFPNTMPVAAERLRVLVVEPDNDTRSLYRQILELAGHDIVEAADGRDALVKALGGTAQLVLTETRLPLVDGYALCEILRNDKATRAVPILVITSESRPDRIQRARALGATAVLVKPVNPDIILEQMRRLTDADGRDADGTSSTTAAAAPTVDAEIVTGTVRRRATLSKTHQRFDTTNPPAPAPKLHCPTCDAPLAYQYSHVGGVSSRHPEQWDYYFCPRSCGTFEYRQRTRKVRRVNDPIIQFPR